MLIKIGIPICVLVQTFTTSTLHIIDLTIRIKLSLFPVDLLQKTGALMAQIPLFIRPLCWQVFVYDLQAKR